MTDTLLMKKQKKLVLLKRLNYLINIKTRLTTLLTQILNNMEKKKSHAFGKDVYLLGADSEGTYYWLEAPKWNCNWYWGFGYIETYTNNERPDFSRDIQSHEHADNFMSKWFTSWNGSYPRLKESTFSKEEGWELSELFAQFYFLKKAAEMFGMGKANIAKTTIPLWKDEAKVKEINEVLIPMVTKRIIEILTPSEDGSK